MSRPCLRQCTRPASASGWTGKRCGAGNGDWGPGPARGKGLSQQRLPNERCTERPDPCGRGAQAGRDVGRTMMGCNGQSLLWSGMASGKGRGSGDQQASPWTKCEVGYPSGAECHRGQLEQEGAWPSRHHPPVPAPAPPGVTPWGQTHLQKETSHPGRFSQWVEHCPLDKRVTG